MVQLLVSHNHSWEAIQEYTLSEVGVFVREAMREDWVKFRTNLLSNWLGTNADKKALDGLLAQEMPQEKQRKSKDLTADVAKTEWMKLAKRLNTLSKH